MKIPRLKDHVKGKCQLAIFARMEDGSTVEFTSTKPLDPKSDIYRYAAKALLAALEIA